VCRTVAPAGPGHGLVVRGSRRRGRCPGGVTAGSSIPCGRAGVRHGSDTVSEVLPGQRHSRYRAIANWRPVVAAADPGMKCAVVTGG
jgi:hypothetical protein